MLALVNHTPDGAQTRIVTPRRSALALDMLGQLGRREVRWAVIDTETTGLLDPMPVQVGIYYGLTGLTQSWWCNPGRLVEPEAAALHPFPASAWEGARPAHVVLAEVRETLRKQRIEVLVAWNAIYDADVCGWPVTWWCAKHIAGALAPLAGARLSKYAARYDVALDNAHDAVADAVATAEVLDAMYADLHPDRQP